MSADAQVGQELVQSASGLADEASGSPEAFTKRVEDFIHNFDSAAPLEGAGTPELVRTLYAAHEFAKQAPTPAAKGYLEAIYASLGPAAAQMEFNRIVNGGSSDIKLGVLRDPALKESLRVTWFRPEAKDSENLLLGYVIAADNLPAFSDGDKRDYKRYVAETFEGLQDELAAIYQARGTEAMRARLFMSVRPPSEWKKTLAAVDPYVTPMSPSAEPAKPASKPKVAPGGARKLDARKSVVAGAPVVAPTVADTPVVDVSKGEKGGKAPGADAAEASAKTDGADTKRADMPNPYAPADKAKDEPDALAVEMARVPALQKLAPLGNRIAKAYEDRNFSPEAMRGPIAAQYQAVELTPVEKAALNGQSVNFTIHGDAGESRVTVTFNNGIPIVSILTPSGKKEAESQALLAERKKLFENSKAAAAALIAEKGTPADKRRLEDLTRLAAKAKDPSDVNRQIQNLGRLTAGLSGEKTGTKATDTAVAGKAETPAVGKDGEAVPAKPVEETAPVVSDGAKANNKDNAGFPDPNAMIDDLV